MAVSRTVDVLDEQTLDRLLRLAEIVERSPDAIVIVDANRVMRDLNPAAEALFGYSHAELVGRHADVVIPPELREPARERWHRLLGGERITAFESERQRRDGSRVCVQVRLLVTDPRAGRFTGAIIFREIRGRRDHEREVAEQTSRQRSLSARASSTPVGSAFADVTPRTGENIDNALSLMREQLGMQVAWLTEMTDTEQVFHALDGEYERHDTRPGMRIPREHSVCHQMLAGAVAELVPDARLEPALGHLSAVRDGRVGAYIGVPVELDGQVWGTLCATSDHAVSDLGHRDVALLRVLAGMLGAQLEHDRRQHAQERLQSELTAAAALLAAVDARDGVTGGRSQNVVELATSVALELGLGDRDLDVVQQVALLHDLGKVAIPDAVLHKPGPLSEAEHELMREHPAIGARILRSVAPLAHLARIVRAEHERVDGAGYPDGLTGPEIPIVARIVFACDAYHAMRSARPHQEAIGREAACAELRRCAGSQFDATVVAALLAVLDG